MAMIENLRPDLPSLRVVACTDPVDRDGIVSLYDAVQGNISAAGLAPVAMGPNEVYRMAFTSGTTGNPKAVIHSHNTTLSACRIQNDDLDIRADDVFLLYLPLGLNWGYLALLQTVIAGARAVLLDKFSAAAALSLIETEKVTYIPTSPASIIAMLNEPDLERYDLSSLRLVVSGGASCPVETIREYRKKMQGHFIELYGMLESGFHTYTRPDGRRGGGQRHRRQTGVRASDCEYSTRTGTTSPPARRARSPVAARRSISATITTRPPMPLPLPPTAGTGPAIWDTSIPRATL